MILILVLVVWLELSREASQLTEGLTEGWGCDGSARLAACCRAGPDTLAATALKVTAWAYSTKRIVVLGTKLRVGTCFWCIAFFERTKITTPQQLLIDS